MMIGVLIPWRRTSRQMSNPFLPGSIASRVMTSGLCWGIACLGQKDQAFQWFEKAYQDRNQDLIFLRLEPKLEPKLDDLRTDSRFADLMGRLGLSSSA